MNILSLPASSLCRHSFQKNNSPSTCAARLAFVLLGLFALLATAPGLKAQSLYVTNGTSTNFTSGTHAYVATYIGSTNHLSTDSNNSLTVTGNNTLLTNSGNLTIGSRGSSNSLVITNGGMVVDYNSFVGAYANSSNNSVVVTGSNSVWSNSSVLVVGNSGSGTVTVANGGSVVASEIDIAQNPGSVGTLNIGTYGGTDGAGTITVTATSISFGSGTGAINFNQTNSFTLSSAITGAGSVNQLGTGTTILTGNNTYSGLTYIASGSTLQVGNGGASGNLGYSSVSNNGTLIFDLSTNLTISGGISGAGALDQIGTGTTILTGSSSYSGNTLVSNGTLVVSGAGVLGSGSYSGALSVGTNASFLWTSSANQTFSNLTNGAASGTITLAGTGTVTLSSPTNTNSAFGFNGVLNIEQNTVLTGGPDAHISGLFYASAINIFSTNGSATLTLAGGDNSFIGAAGSPTLTLGTNGVLYNPGSYSFNLNTPLILNGGTLGSASSISGQALIWGTYLLDQGVTVLGNSTISALNVALTESNGTVISVTNGATLLVSGYFGTNSTSGLVKTGAGTIVLTGANTYTTPTTISAGTLQVGNGGMTGTPGTGNITNNGSLVFDLASALTVSNVISGSGSLSQIGTGTITLTQSNSYSLGTVLSSGGIVTANAYALGSGPVSMTGGTLTVETASLHVSSLVWNGGVVALPQAGSGIHLVSTGALYLTGLGTFNLSGASLSAGSQTALLEAANISSYSTNQFTVSGLSGNYELLINGDALYIEMLGNSTAYPSFTIPGLTPNQQQVAGALNTWASNNPTGDKATVLNAVTNLPTSSWGAAFDQMSARLYQQIATTAFNLANAENQQLIQRLYGLRIAGSGFSMNGLSANMPVLEGQGDGDKNPKNPASDILRPGLDNRWGMFLDGYGVFAQANSANMLPDYKSESGGVNTGLTYKWNDHFGSGLYVGYQGSYAKNSGLGTLIDNAVKFGAFGTYGSPDGKGFYTDGLIGGGYHNEMASRTIDFGSISRTADSSPGAGELDSMLAAGYSFRKGNWNYGPLASLQYTYLNEQSFTETGAQSLDQNNQGWNTSSMLSSLGANAAYTWQANPNLMVVPQVNLSWQHEFLQNPYTIESSMGGSPFNNTSSTPNRDTLYTGVGVTMEYKKKWNTSFFYNASVGNQNLQSQNIFWSAGLSL